MYLFDPEYSRHDPERIHYFVTQWSCIVYNQARAFTDRRYEEEHGNNGRNTGFDCVRKRYSITASWISLIDRPAQIPKRWEPADADLAAGRR